MQSFGVRTSLSSKNFFIILMFRPRRVVTASMNTLLFLSSVCQILSFAVSLIQIFCTRLSKKYLFYDLIYLIVNLRLLYLIFTKSSLVKKYMKFNIIAVLKTISSFFNIIDSNSGDYSDKGCQQL